MMLNAWIFAAVTAAALILLIIISALADGTCVRSGGVLIRSTYGWTTVCIPASEIK